MTDILHARTNPVTGRFEVVAQVGETTVSEYCGNLVSQCEQKRIALARRSATVLADLRTQINRLDHWLRRDADELARETAEAARAEDREFVPPFPPLVFWIVAVLISTLEVFVNKYGMDGLRMTDSASWAMSLLAALSIFLLSKLTGQVLRQRPWQQGEWGGVAIAIMFNIVLVATAIHIADARAFMAAQEAAAEGRETMEGMVAGVIALVLLGYGVMLFATYRNTPPSAAAEQRLARIAALRHAVDRRWQERIGLARSYNRVLAQVSHDLEAMAQDLAERSYQFRCGVKRGGQTPACFRHALPLDTLKPIHVGRMIDPQPESICALVGKDADNAAVAATAVAFAA